MAPLPRTCATCVNDGGPVLGCTETSVITVTGTIEHGIGAWRPRMTRFPEVFRRATGEELFPGTLNVRIDAPLPIEAEIRISGAEIEEPEQDVLLERCRINGIRAYRLRPFQPATGAGGHGDHILEIVCTQELRPLLSGSDTVVVEFPRGAAER